MIRFLVLGWGIKGTVRTGQFVDFLKTPLFLYSDKVIGVIYDAAVDQVEREMVLPMTAVR